MSVEGYNMIPDINDNHAISVDYDERYDEITVSIGNDQNSEEIALTLSDRQMQAIAEYIQWQKSK